MLGRTVEGWTLLMVVTLALGIYLLFIVERVVRSGCSRIVGAASVRPFEEPSGGA
jgi:hypothetical protein